MFYFEEYQYLDGLYALLGVWMRLAWEIMGTHSCTLLGCMDEACLGDSGYT